MSVSLSKMKSSMPSGMGSLRKGLLLSHSFLRWGSCLRRANSSQSWILFSDISSSLRKENCSMPRREANRLLLRLRDSVWLEMQGLTQSMTVMLLEGSHNRLSAIWVRSPTKEDRQTCFCLRIPLQQQFILQQLSSLPPSIKSQSSIKAKEIAILYNNLNQKRMADKYYHNDYKKMMGVDQSRTASEKLLDRAIGGFKSTPGPISKPVQKKVKEENMNLTHIEILNKLIKNIENNKTAGKLIKPLNILKKCINDQAFVNAPEINTFQQWNTLVALLMDCDEKLVGNYSQIGLVIDCLAEIFAAVLASLKKIRGGESVKQQNGVKLQENKGEEPRQASELIEMCQVHLTFLKMFTDDSFSFNKLLLELKGNLNSYFEQRLLGKTNEKPQLQAYLQRLLMKMFNLPHAKYEWLKQSLSQFFKDFNIAYKHTLSEQQFPIYLKAYNEFTSHKASKGTGESVSIFGSGPKGGKVATIELGAVDGLDKWTSKQ